MEEIHRNMFVQYHKHMVRDLFKKIDRIDKKLEKLTAITGDPNQKIETQRYWQSEAQYDVLHKERQKYIEFLIELNVIRDFVHPVPLLVEEYHFVWDYVDTINEVRF